MGKIETAKNWNSQEDVVFNSRVVPSKSATITRGGGRAGI
jgi:hypothetical protein